jgi:quercetin dioxygenase-like cupin family protein
MPELVPDVHEPLTNHKAIVVPAREGERRTLLGDVIITTVGAGQTNGQFSLIGNAGPRGARPIPMHFHEHEHEMFMPIRGTMQLWVAGESRILRPGDFGSVPEGVVHAYHFLGRHNQFLGYAMPGGFERMFRITGEPWDGYVHPAAGASGPPPFERFKQAEIEMHMKYVDDPYVEATDGPDDALPGACEPYLLKAGEGDRRLLLDQVFTSIMRSEESDGQAALFHAQGPKGAVFPAHHHDETSVGIWVLDGALKLTIDDEQHVLIPGDFAYVPPGCVWSYVMGSHFTQLHVIATPAGVERLFARASEPYPHYVFPSHVVTEPDLGRLAEAAEGLDFHLAER